MVNGAAKTGLYKVVTVDGESIALPKARAKKIARWLADPKKGTPVAAKVVAA